jgi:[CysO sulfur-carrier protein]-S-L-cysteine hydrolase
LQITQIFSGLICVICVICGSFLNQINQAIRLPGAIYAEAAAHLRRCYPAEGCGFWAGCDGRIDRHYPIANIARDPIRYYRMDPAAQLAALLAIEAQERELIAIYHSHPHGPARPSVSDVAEWRYPEAAMVILSLADDGRPTLRAYRLAQGNVIDCSLIIEPT